MVKSANTHRTNVSFKVNDGVFLKLHPHRRQSVVSCVHPKLSVHYYGPYEVEQKIGFMSYRLQVLERC